MALGWIVDPYGITNALKPLYAKDRQMARKTEEPAAEQAAPEPAPVLLPSLTANAKRDILKSFDFVARREGVAGEALEQMNTELRAVLGA